MSRSSTPEDLHMLFAPTRRTPRRGGLRGAGAARSTPRVKTGQTGNGRSRNIFKHTRTRANCYKADIEKEIFLAAALPRRLPILSDPEPQATAGWGQLAVALGAVAVSQGMQGRVPGRKIFVQSSLGAHLSVATRWVQFGWRCRRTRSRGSDCRCIYQRRARRLLLYRVMRYQGRFLMCHTAYLPHPPRPHTMVVGRRRRSGGCVSTERRCSVRA